MSNNTEKSKKKVLEVLKINPLISPACRKSDVAKSSFYRWIKEDKVFNKAVKESQMMGRAIICDAAESKVLSLLNSDSEEMVFKASKYILNNLHPTYRLEREGIQYQKAKLKDEIEKEKENRVENYEMIKKLLGLLLKSAEESEKEKNDRNTILALQEGVKEIDKFKDNLTNKNLEKENDVKNKIKDFI
jgi:hypothetical protein